MNTETTRKRYMYFMDRCNEESVRVAMKHLEELGIRVLNRQGCAALVALSTPEQVEAAHRTGLFRTISKEAIKTEHFERLTPEQVESAQLWNTLQSPEYHKVKSDRTERGKSWGDPRKDPEPPHLDYDPDEFKERLQEYLQVEEDEILEKYQVEKPEPLSGERFIRFEKELAEIYKNETYAYHVARMAFYLPPAYHNLLLEAELLGFLEVFFSEPACWRMENEISVGIVFVESSRSGGPRFSGNDRNTLRAEIADGLDWLAGEAPIAAHLTWVYDWQFVNIDVANGTSSSQEDYWRNPAMGQVNYYGDTYTMDWNGVAAYREDVRRRNRSSHAIVIFVTPYGTSWHAYANAARARVTLADRNNWGGWGIGAIDSITAHEVCHLFGASDEYSGSGTPCSSCNTLHGCNQIPNGNCASCARPHQTCIMDHNDYRICAYTRAHIGWADLFVELTTADELWAGTDDDVWLDMGDRTFYLDTANHNDRERDNIEGYALTYTGVKESDIKRVGIRKSPDGFAGGWKLKRVRLWLKDKLICENNHINQWLEDDYRWWASTSCGMSADIVNRLRVRITTADVLWAGTDDDVTLYVGGRGWNLDNPGHNDYERGNTDTFDLDPGPSLYLSMLSSIRIRKSPDGIAGGWKLKGLQIYVNGTRIYNNQSINKWLEDNDRDWFGTI